MLVERGRKPTWRLLAEQFANTMIVVLVAAAAVAAALGDLKDNVVILAILVLNGGLGFVQEYRAEQAMAALKAMTLRSCASAGAAGSRTGPRPRWCQATWSCSGRATCSPPTCA